jgi:hypothetical protein
MAHGGPGQVGIVNVAEPSGEAARADAGPGHGPVVGLSRGASGAETGGVLLPEEQAAGGVDDPMDAVADEGEGGGWG